MINESAEYPKDQPDIEIKILKKLFTPEEAEMYLNLTEDLQTAEQIAKKIGSDTNKTEALLQRMTEKGHTFPRFPKKEGEPFFRKSGERKALLFCAFLLSVAGG